MSPGNGFRVSSARENAVKPLCRTVCGDYHFLSTICNIFRHVWFCWNISIPNVCKLKARRLNVAISVNCFKTYQFQVFFSLLTNHPSDFHKILSLQQHHQRRVKQTRHYIQECEIITLLQKLYFQQAILSFDSNQVGICRILFGVEPKDCIKG